MFKKRIHDAIKRIRVPTMFMVLAFAFITLATIAYPALSTELRITGEISFEPNYVDESGANKPNLASNMIPVKWDGSNWVKADDTNAKCDWYNYSKQMWANVVTVTSAKRNTYQNAPLGTVISESDILTYLVWIPRYKYKLWNTNNGSSNEQEIEIEFENGTATTGTGSTNGQYLTHPSFTFGTSKLTGYWVGKFETSGSISTACTMEACATANLTIKPNLTGIINQTVSSMFYASRSMSRSGNQYGFDSSTEDTHMMKNMEWGAVAYLSHSKYGQNTKVTINNSSDFITGCAGNSVSENYYNGCQNAYNTVQGGKASTTGNIYGIYDMSGGTNEYVMGNMVNQFGDFYSSGAQFSSAPASKYYDSYTNGTTGADSTGHARGLLGDATKETLKIFGGGYDVSWYNNNSQYARSSSAWFSRGGASGGGTGTGLFSTLSYTGVGTAAYGFRIVVALTPKEVTEYKYDYTGGEQKFVAPTSGTYKIELWGAQGGSNELASGGKGSYTSGEIYLTQGQAISIYVGGAGVTSEINPINSGYNGGGIGALHNPSANTNFSIYGGGGGGATDIRLKSGVWDDSGGLNSRIMVAAGGGGAANWSLPRDGGAGGALIGNCGMEYEASNPSPFVNASGGTQISGGLGSIGAAASTNTSGNFGIGGNSSSVHGSGGGGGYYGGGGSGYNTNVVGSGAGGSSFISGHTGCNAITSETNRTHTGQSNHYSGKVFTNSIMIAGNASMPNSRGGGNITGNSGNGYAKITLLSY